MVVFDDTYTNTILPLAQASLSGMLEEVFICIDTSRSGIFATPAMLPEWLLHRFYAPLLSGLENNWQYAAEKITGDIDGLRSYQAQAPDDPFNRARAQIGKNIHQLSALLLGEWENQKAIGDVGINSLIHDWENKKNASLKAHLFCYGYLFIGELCLLLDQWCQCDNQELKRKIERTASDFVEKNPQCKKQIKGANNKTYIKGQLITEKQLLLYTELVQAFVREVGSMVAGQILAEEGRVPVQFTAWSDKLKEYSSGKQGYTGLPPILAELGITIDIKKSAHTALQTAEEKVLCDKDTHNSQKDPPSENPLVRLMRQIFGIKVDNQEIQ